jgi:hypothetical protein
MLLFTHISTKLKITDRLSAWRVRWGIGRNTYRVAPGLYAAGEAGSDSPVLVTANYKLSFDEVRRHLTGIDAWVLVLDTKGINVWCAAGKGTFGTEELVRRIAETNLADKVSHRRLILPQLGASGVAAHKVKALSGFSVLYGPVLAKDIPAYLASGCIKTSEMKKVPFGFRERLVLIPVELTGAKLLYPVLIAAALLLSAISPGPRPGVFGFGITLFGSVLAGAVITPLLLPWIPFRAFALKGAIAGLIWAGAAVFLFSVPSVPGVGLALIVTALSSFLAMNFTGASTYTSQSGVAREVKIGIPLQTAGAVSGGILIALETFL